jgi:hypothetical protein
LAEAFQAVVVDIDDADRGRLVLPRFQAQELVKDIQAELHERRSSLSHAKKATSRIGNGRM